MTSLPDDLPDRADWPDPAAVEAAVARGRAAVAGAGSFESAALVRAERDARHAGV